jgi:hypothetical protein
LRDQDLVWVTGFGSFGRLDERDHDQDEDIKIKCDTRQIVALDVELRKIKNSAWTTQPGYGNTIDQQACLAVSVLARPKPGPTRNIDLSKKATTDSSYNTQTSSFLSPGRPKPRPNLAHPQTAHPAIRSSFWSITSLPTSKPPYHHL